jgi:hypothetical protein
MKNNENLIIFVFSVIFRLFPLSIPVGQPAVEDR